MHALYKEHQELIRSKAGCSLCEKTQIFIISIGISCRRCTDFLIVVLPIIQPAALHAEGEELTPEIRQAMGLLDVIHGVAVAGDIPGPMHSP